MATGLLALLGCASAAFAGLPLPLPLPEEGGEDRVPVLTGSLQAAPNPCVIPAGKTVCSASLTWASTSASAEVWISDLDGANPQLFARAKSGTSSADWISTQSRRFHLKTKGWDSLTLATVDVRGEPAPPPVTPAVVLTRRYVYDGHKRLCKVIEPETGATVIGYDAAGNETWRAAGLELPSATDCDHAAAWSSGRRVDRTFDARNRVATLAFPDGRGDQAWTYTPHGLVDTIATWNDAGGEPVLNTYRYNARRQLTDETIRHGGYVSTVRYGYDASGHRNLYVTPDGLAVHSELDALGRPLRVHTAWGKDFASGAQYHPNGALKQFTYGNGIVRTLAQNARQLPERTTDAHGGFAFLDDAYDFDANGNVAAITDGASGREQRGNRTMVYDGLDRLFAATSPMFGTAIYRYDAADRRTLAQVTGGSAPREHWYCYDASHRLTNVKSGGCGGASVIGLGYDAQGNVTNKNGQAFDFDFGNRLRAAAGKETYAYDGHGRRILAADAAGVPIRSHYDAAGRLVYQQDERRTLNVPHVYLGDRLVATFEWNATTHTIETRYQHTDALGSPVVVTDEDRNVVERSEYEPYGRLLNRPIAGGVGYTGPVADASTGNVYLQARYMDPLLGMFESVDAVTAYGTGDWRYFGRYGYAFNNPYRYTDPDGRCPTCDKFSESYAAMPGPERKDLRDGLVEGLKWIGRVFLELNSGGASGGGKLATGGAIVKGSRIAHEAAPTKAATKVRNSHLAGGAHPKTRIPFDANGFPDFSRVATVEVRISQTGSRAGDFRAANDAAGLKRTPEGYTWHHHQDGTTMQLVPRDIHTQTGHTGGFILQRGSTIGN